MKLRPIALQLGLAGVASVVAALFATSGRAADAGVDNTAPRYTIDGSAVLDNKTGLHWEQSLRAEADTWSGSQMYCATLDLDGAHWRLPSVAELQTLIDETRSMPAIDTDAFPDTPSEYFWTSSKLPRFDNFVWAVYFGSGLSTFFDVTDLRYVRCVH
jgi:hypothetical protein